jgi:4-hydroxy-4-methyl-2-oxoglutarate aldolase
VTVSAPARSELLERLAQFPTAVISDTQRGLGVLRPAIRSMVPGARVVGPAHTVKCYPGSIITVHKALFEAKPGEILVVDGEGDERGALWGELMTRQAMVSGLAGIVIDGPLRDRESIAEAGFPAFATCVTPRVGTNRRVGETQLAIQCGGIVVRPGDIVLGDSDGVVIVPIEQLQSVIEGAEEVKRKEAALRAGITEGKQLGDLLGFRALIYGS